MSERLVELPSGRTLATSIRWARSPVDRARGLVGTRSIPAHAALVIPRARQVHTFGMRYPIDVCFCDAGWRILHVARLRPLRMSRWVPRSRFVIEMAAGAAEGLETGDQLSLEESRER